MNTVEVHGEKYIKASVAAKEAGYTADYVGQLCRKNLLDATLVGRTWYVREGAVGDYKKNKSRQNNQKTIKEMEQELERSQNQEQKIHKTMYVPGVTPEYRKQLLSSEIKYESEAEELLPAPQKIRTQDVAEDVVDTEREEVSEENIIPINTEAESMEGVIEEREEADDEAVYSSDALMALEEDFGDEKAQEEEEYQEEVDRIVAERKSMLPMLATTLGALLLSLSVLLQNVWIYDYSSDTVTLSSTTRFETGYAIASVGHIYKEIESIF